MFDKKPCNLGYDSRRVVAGVQVFAVTAPQQVKVQDLDVLQPVSLQKRAGVTIRLKISGDMTRRFGSSSRGRFNGMRQNSLRPSMNTT